MTTKLQAVTLAFVVSVGLSFAQEKPAAEPEKKKEAPEESPAVEGPTAPERMVHGSVEVGYRVVGDIHGSSDAYRNIVNLGEGPRLIEADLTISPSLK